MLQTELLAAGQQQGVVAVDVRLAVGAAVEDEGGVQEALSGVTIFGFLQALNEAGEILRKELVELAEDGGLFRFARLVSEAVPVGFKSKRGRESAGNGRAIAADLVTRDPGEVGLEGEEHQVVDRGDVGLCTIGIGIQRDVAGVDIRQRNFEPGTGAFNTEFHVADRGFIFVQLATISRTEIATQVL